MSARNPIAFTATTTAATAATARLRARAPGPDRRAAAFVGQLLVCLVAGLLARQSTAQAVAPGREPLIVQNLAREARSEWVSTVVPFARGEAGGTGSAAGLPDLHVEGHHTVWQPFGARWPDGSLRQAIACYRVQVPAGSERHFRLVEGPGPRASGQPSFGLPTHAIVCEAKVGGETHRALLTPTEFLERNDARQIVVLRARVGDSGLVVEAPLTIWDRQAHGELGVGVFFSDPSTPAMELEVEELSIVVDGLAWFPRHARQLAIQGGATPRGSRHVLLRDTKLADGMGVRRVGAILPPFAPESQREFNDTLRAAATCQLLSATSWAASGAFGAFGFVPPPPPWLATPGALRKALARRHQAFVADAPRSTPDPLQAPRFGPAKNPGQAGEQADFGVVAAEAVAWSGQPSFFYELELSVLQEGCRPVHVFETDASPVLSANHPDWVVWNGRTHYNAGQSPDRLGKPDELPRFDMSGWRGKDRAHWSSNYLCAYALLSGAPSARLEIANEVQLYLAAQTLSPRVYTSKPGVSRSAGRTMLAATWLWLCTGNADLKERMRRRMRDINLPSWMTADFEAGRMRPFQFRKPDPRYLDVPEAGKIPVWVPWEESLTVTGFAAYLELTEDPDPELREMVDQIALTILEHAMRDDPRHGAQIAYAMAWHDGVPPRGEERNDPARIKWPSSNFGMWAMGALEVGRDAAIRHDRPELAERAEHYLKRLRSRRSVPRDGFYDRMSQWDGVRIESDSR